MPRRKTRPSKTSPRRSTSQPTVVSQPVRRNTLSRWRAATLAFVYVLMAVHITHWRIAGETLAPLELNEVMYTLELGIVTAGFLFMLLAAVSAAIFGRFFCSWGCHILALEDLCAWGLKKLGIRPKPIRSRVLFLVPPGAMFYMFIWPQVSRILAGRALPEMHVQSDQQGWASFLTTDFWRNLPGPWITVITFAICGFAIVYFLGSRGFCTYGCPYGVLFAVADRFAPGRIKLKGECQQCGTCTATCQSHVRVHDELRVFGRVVNPACMKDLDCVSACPHGVLGYGLTRPSLLDSFRSIGDRRTRYDFGVAEEFLMAAVFVASLLIFRGLYGAVPFLMTLAIGAILAYLSVLAVRLCTRADVRLNNFLLKRDRRLTATGRAFAACIVLLASFAMHSAFVRYHEFRGHRAFAAFQGDSDHRVATGPSPAAAAALGHLEKTRRWGIFEHPQLDARLAALYEATDSLGPAEETLRRILRNSPGDVPARLSLGRVLVRRGRQREAVTQLERVVRMTAPQETDGGHLDHIHVEARQLLGETYMKAGDPTRAALHIEAALTVDPNSAQAHLVLGELRANQGRLEDATSHFRAAIESRPDLALAHYNLGVMMAALGRDDEAEDHYRSALRLDAADPDVHNNLGLLHLKRGELDQATRHFREALDLRPDFAHAHFNLGRILQQQGRLEEAGRHFESAAQAEPRYAELLGP